MWFVCVLVTWVVVQGVLVFRWAKRKRALWWRLGLSTLGFFLVAVVAEVAYSQFSITRSAELELEKPGTELAYVRRGPIRVGYDYVRKNPEGRLLSAENSRYELKDWLDRPIELCTAALIVGVPIWVMCYRRGRSKRVDVGVG